MREKTTLHCPCGQFLRGTTEDELVEVAQAHLTQEHPDLDYSREEILMFAL